MFNRSLIFTVALSLLSTVARADTILTQGLPPVKATIIGFANGRLEYQAANGNVGNREYSRVMQLVIDAEPALNAAEAAHASGKPADSLDDYANAIRATNTPWVRVFAARRLLDAAGADGRFEPRLTAYLALLAYAPADAAGRQPPLPEAGSRLLDVAVTEVESALKAPKLADPAKVTLLNFLTEIHRRRGDETNVVATVERMARASPAAASDPVVQAQLTGLKIAQAKAMAEKRDFTGAARLIDDSRAAIVDPLQQADALYLLAQAKLATADATDNAALSDAALTFMRVVAHADALPGRPNVLASLRATADVLERTGRPADAAKVYVQIVRDYATSPAAVAIAKADLERLKAKQ